MRQLVSSFLVVLCASGLGARDVVVYGSTPGGIACAVRAAREGAEVLLVTHAEHVGGLLTSGLSTMDALYRGRRAPVYDELRRGIHDHYRETYGGQSAQYQASLPGNAKPKFEARIVERLLEEMLAREPRIKVMKGWFPVSVERSGALVRAAVFRQMHGAATRSIAGQVFVDCSYEGDLAAVAGVPCRTGREAREEFGEEHAGRIFMRPVKWPPAGVDPAYLAEYRRLNLVHYNRWYEMVRPQSTGAADPAVQAYNMRTVLTNDPANRVPVGKPANYDRDALQRRLDTDANWSPRIPRTELPNRKTYWNLPELLGVQNAYANGDWAARQRVARDHSEFTLALLYFLQNDESIAEPTRRQWREWGLPKDEFPDHGHMPYEVYMRETRRITGRAIFTEHDARRAADLKRAPVHADSIGITDWFLDSHACTAEKMPGSLWEGELLLNNITVPGQVSWRCLLPEKIDNLIVPGCLSSSHIGWGAIRLEPTWMSLGEAAAHAIVAALREKVTPADMDNDTLVRLLAERGIMVAFFNDVEKHVGAPWYPAVQYLGTQGFFGSYDARPLEPLTDKLADAWVTRSHDLAHRAKGDTTQAARAIWRAELAAGDPVTAADFARRLESALEAGSPRRVIPGQLERLGIAPSAPITRADACRLIYTLTSKAG